ncbi:hypothetical protein FRC12_017465, partial [Ceratobasidium sp. 428]
MRPRSYLAWLPLLLCQVASQTTNETVDDSFSFSFTNPGGIQYFPSESSWLSTAPSNPTQRFDQTVHVTNVDSTRVMHFFQGDAIYYYGDKGPGYGALVVSVDGGYDAQRDTVNASSSTPEYQQLLWSRTGLGPGDHQIILTREDKYGSSQISMDYFRIVSSNSTIVPSLAGPGASVVPKEALIVDDTDNSISYSGGWELIQSPTAAISPRNVCFFQNTIHRTTIPNATANFTFVGTAVWYFSDIDSTHGYVKISVDGAAPEQVSGFHQPQLSQRLIWHKTGLSQGQHVVTIAHGGQPTQYATVDFLMYLPSNTTTTVPNSSTPDASQQPSKNRPRPIRMSVIIGVAVGGVIGLGVFLYGALLVYQRRVYRKRFIEQPTTKAAAESQLYESTPFILDPQTQASPTHRIGPKHLNLNSVSSYTGTSGMSEYSFTTTGAGTSRGFADYNPYDPPPSY